MALPLQAIKGTRLTANYLNKLRAEIRRNNVTAKNGVSSIRTDSGTSVFLDTTNRFGTMPGRIVSVLNTTGGTLDAFAVAGIEQSTVEGNLIDALSQGVGYVLRKPETDDLLFGWVILAEQIKDKSVGQAYISGDGVLARIKYNEDGSEDDLLFAEIDPDKTGDDLFFLYPRDSGSARILDAETLDTNPVKGWRWAIIRFPVGGVGGTLDNPHDLTYTGEHSEEASTNFYTNAESEDVMIDLREPPEGTQGFKITMQTGESYFDDSDETLYSYVVNIFVNSAGSIVKILREVRPVTDVPEDCDVEGEAAAAQQMMGG